MNRTLYLGILLILAIFISCNDDDKSISSTTKYLTSATWGERDEIIHNSGYSYNNGCKSLYNFYKNGKYKEVDCYNEIQMEGNWKWTIPDKELRLETYFGGFSQRTHIIKIIEISKDRLHTYQITDLGDSIFVRVDYIYKRIAE